MIGSMLKDCLKMTLSPSFLLCIVLHGLLKMNRQGGNMQLFGCVAAARLLIVVRFFLLPGCHLFLRVYQSLQAVYTSAV